MGRGSGARGARPGCQRGASDTAVYARYIPLCERTPVGASARGADRDVVLLGHDLLPLLGGQAAAGDEARLLRPDRGIDLPADRAPVSETANRRSPSGVKRAVNQASGRPGSGEPIGC